MESYFGVVSKDVLETIRLVETRNLRPAICTDHLTSQEIVMLDPVEELYGKFCRGNYECHIDDTAVLLDHEPNRWALHNVACLFSAS